MDGLGVVAAREEGARHVRHQFWQRLHVEAILAHVGLRAQTRLLTWVMTLNRLIQPRSEHAMVDWVNRTAMADILTKGLTTLDDDLRELMDRAIGDKRQTRLPADPERLQKRIGVRSLSTERPIWHQLQHRVQTPTRRSARPSESRLR